MQIVRAARGWHIWLGVAALSVGCATDVGTSVQHIDGASFDTLQSGEDLWVDLTDPTLAAVIDQETARLDRIVLVCPNGAAMRFERWAEEQEVGPDGSRFVSLGLDLEQVADALDGVEEEEDCQPTCYACADGVVICSGCGRDTSHHGMGTPLPSARELQPYAPPDPTDPGSGGSGGDGEVPGVEPPREGGSSGGGSSGGSSGGGHSGGGHGGGGGHSGGGHSGGGGHPGW